MFRLIRDTLRRELHKMYKCAEQAFAAMDFSGKGFVTHSDFFESIIVKNKTKFSKDQVKEFLDSQNLFQDGETGITFDAFKKYFFPQHYFV